MWKKGGHMFLKITRFVSLICAALAFGLTATHDLEIPGKQMLSGADWLTVQQTFYGGFAIVGGVAEVLGLISTGLLVYLLWKRRAGFALTLIAAISFAGMLALFAFGNNPLNQQIASWTPETLPANWREIRNAWDGFHAASSALAALALTSLLIATLRDTSSGVPTKGSQRVDHRKEGDFREPHFQQGD
jgi:multisubunit Na+/H+ antiporter MnhB subunit